MKAIDQLHEVALVLNRLTPVDRAAIFAWVDIEMDRHYFIGTGSRIHVKN